MNINMIIGAIIGYVSGTLILCTYYWLKLRKMDKIIKKELKECNKISDEILNMLKL